MLAQRSLPFALAAAALCGCGRTGNLPPAETPAPAARAPAPVEAAPERAEPAAPAETRFSLCVLDAAAGLRSLTAVRRAGEPDTFALVDRRRVPLAEAVGDVRVAGQTTWFPARRNLIVSLGPGRLPRRFAIYDVGRIIEAGDLAFLGNVEGMPLFAAAEDVAPVKAELVRLLAADKDLPRNLAASSPLRTRFRALEVVYVPLRSTGCVFQGLVRVANPAPRPASPAPVAPVAPTPPVR